MSLRGTAGVPFEAQKLPVLTAVFLSGVFGVSDVYIRLLNFVPSSTRIAQIASVHSFECKL